MPTDRAYLKQQQAGALSSAGASDAIGAVSEAHRQVVVVATKASDDAMASTTTAETYTGVSVPRACRVKKLTFTPTTGGITAHATDYATITVSKRDAAAGNKTTLGTITTTIASSGNLSQGVAEEFVLSTTAGALDLVAGGSFTFEIAKAASGVVVRAGVILADLEWV